MITPTDGGMWMRHRRLPRSTTRAEFELGILFVHGLGQQVRGNTLLTYSDAVYDLVQRAASHDSAQLTAFRQDQQITLQQIHKDRSISRRRRRDLRREVESRPLPAPTFVRFDGGIAKATDPAGSPAHLTLALGQQDRWCLAESWWAEEFAPPPPRAFLAWVIKNAPEVMHLHLCRRIRQLQHRQPDLQYTAPIRAALWLWRVLMASAMVLAVLMLMPAVLLLLVVLWVLALLPVPRLSGWVGRMAARATGAMGDSFVVVNSDAQYGAMLARVKSDLRWLTSRCRSVAVVAHSQGAFLAVDALRSASDPRVKLLVTWGAGLAKLHALRGERKGLRQKGRGFAAMLNTFLPVPLLVVSFFAFRTEPVVALVYGTLSFTPFVLTVWQLVTTGSEVAADHERLLRDLLPLDDRARGRAPHWVDVTASADPVPGGPIFCEDPEWLTSHRVHNRVSWLRDHTSYHRNPDGVLAPLVSLLLVHCSWTTRQLLRPLSDPVAVEDARRRRSWRLSRLVIARVLLVGCAAVAWWRQHAVLESFAHRFREPGLYSFLGSFLPSAVKPTRTSIDSWLSPLQGKVSLPWDGFLGLLLLVAGGLSVHLLLSWSWRSWERHDVGQLLAGRPIGETALHPVTSVCWVTSMVLVCLSLVVLPATAGAWNWLAQIATVAVFVSATAGISLIKSENPPWVPAMSIENRVATILAPTLVLLLHSLLAFWLLDGPDWLPLVTGSISTLAVWLLLRAGASRSVWPRRWVAPPPSRFGTELAKGL